ncbi:MAG: MOSC domain-containing protein [Longimicrobiales bacterium]
MNDRLPEPFEMRRFRPNIVVAGAAPHAEDAWRRICIGGVDCEVARPCARCAVTTVDPDTAETGKEPLCTLAPPLAARARGRGDRPDAGPARMLARRGAAADRGMGEGAELAADAGAGGLRRRVASLRRAAPPCAPSTRRCGRRPASRRAPAPSVGPGPCRPGS